MWTLYGLAEIGALTGNVVRRWHGRWTGADRQDEERAESDLLAQRMSALLKARLGHDGNTIRRWRRPVRWDDDVLYSIAAARAP